MIAKEVGKASAVTLQPVGPRLGCCVSTPSPLLTGPQNWRATEGFSPPWGPVQGVTCAPAQLPPWRAGACCRLTQMMLVSLARVLRCLSFVGFRRTRCILPRLSCSLVVTLGGIKLRCSEASWRTIY